jgi:hypothetical protein
MRNLKHVRVVAAVWTVAVCLSIPTALFGQQLAKRLILKDGSYQLATKYEIHGDRVRYLSAERGEWEELPKSLIDWPATEKYEKDRAAGVVSPEAAELDKELEAEKAADEARSPHVAPGLQLPDEGGVLLLDNFQGQPQLDQLQQTGGTINKNMKGNILRATINPIASSKQTIEIPGTHAKVQSHITQPTIYVNIDEGQEVSGDQNKQAGQGQNTGEKPDPLRFRIVRAETKPDKRVVGAIKIAMYGKVSQQENLVPTKAELLPGSDWVKITPEAPLPAGEYAVVEMLGKEGVNLFVWDFGVNPSAPANEQAWKPDPSATQPQEDKPVQLQQRPK